MTFSPFRMAKEEDLANLVELWANLSNLRLLEDYERWKWSFRAEKIWLEYARKTLEFEDFVFVVCDYQDNGYSGFLHGHLEFLPKQTMLCLHVLDLYLRPKDKNLKNVLGLINSALKVLEKRSLNLQIEIEISKLDREMISIINQAKASHLIQIILVDRF